MRLSFRLSPILAALLSSCAQGPPASDGQYLPMAPGKFSARECPEQLKQSGARCGTVVVPENRSMPAGRSVALNVVVLPSTSGRTDLPPLVDIDGGPGLPAATKNASFYANEGKAYRSRREIILLDQRGTGASNGLHCPELASPEAASAEMLSLDAVERCRQQLMLRADLAQYGTEPAVQDLDAVRAALGYERVDIFALSYGTTVALRYMARFPGRVRAAVLMGVAPPAAMPPREHATAGERALRLLVADCKADPACRVAFPSLQRSLLRARNQVAEIPNGPTAELFMEKLRALMYSPATARRVPWIIHRAAAGDLTPFNSATRRTQPSIFSDGMFLSVTCSESFGLMNYEAAAAKARKTIFGDYRLRRQRAACELWPKSKPPADHLKPVRSETAVLLVSGRLDPATPPGWADDVAKYLPRSRHLVLHHGGHTIDGLSGIDTCLEPVIIQFLETADPAPLDATCISEMRAPPFSTGN